MKLTTDRLTVSLSPQRFVAVTVVVLLLLTRGVGGGGAPEELWHLREVLVLELIHIFVVTLDLDGDLLSENNTSCTDMQEDTWARLRDSRPGMCAIHAT